MPANGKKATVTFRNVTFSIGTVDGSTTVNDFKSKIVSTAAKLMENLDEKSIDNDHLLLKSRNSEVDLSDGNSLILQLLSRDEDENAAARLRIEVEEAMGIIVKIPDHWEKSTNNVEPDYTQYGMFVFKSYSSEELYDHVYNVIKSNDIGDDDIDQSELRIAKESKNGANPVDPMNITSSMWRSIDGVVDNKDVLVCRRLRINLEEPERLNIKVKEADGSELYFTISKTTRLKKLMDLFCKHQNKGPGSFRFLLNGNTIHPDSTPQQMGMEDEEEIFAYQEARGS